MKLFSLPILLCFLVSNIPAQQLSFKKLTTRQGLSHSTVYAITQDEQGFLWIGTRDGLNRYDSYEIRNYYVNSEKTNFPSNQINALMANGKQLYVGTSNGLSRYLSAKDTFERIAQETVQGSVNQIYRAQDGTIYVCSSRGLYRLRNETEAEPLIPNGPVNSICNYKTNVFWLALNDRVLLINHLGELIKTYQPEHPASYPIQEDRRHTMHRLFRDSEGTIWLITNKGLFRYEQETDRFRFVSLQHEENWIEANVVRDIAEDQDGRLWLGTELGLFIYDKLSGKIEHYNQSFTNLHALSDKSIYAVYISRENIAWMGTYFGGVNYVKPQSGGFNKMVPAENGRSISGKAISQLTQTTDGKLWIGTEDGGISIYDKDQQTFDYLRTGSRPELSCNNVHAILDDERGNVWIGTFLGGLNRYEKADDRIRVYKNNADNPYSLSNNYVYSILKTTGGDLLAGTMNGVNRYDYQRDRFDRFHPEALANRFIYDMLEDRRGDLWFCTRSQGIFRYRVQEDTMIHYQVEGREAHGLSSNQIISVFEDSRGALWFGSLNGGLLHWDPEEEQFSAVTVREGLPDNNVYGVLEDERGHLWLSSNKGLSKYEPEQGEITHFTTAQGLSENQFNFKSFFADPEGWLYFGTVNGLNYFHPDSTAWNTPEPRLYFNSFKLFNREVPIAEDGILSRHIDLTDTLTLRHRDNVLTFEFVAVNYFSEGHNEYAYYLEGFEDDWNEVGNKRTATYTNLSPGSYIFHLRTKSQSGKEAGPERQIYLNVLPPFWQSNWAIGLYGLILLGVIVGYSRFVRFLHQQKLAVQVERVEKEKIREINQHKLNFFTFISHEFKTPLTLIIASIEKFFQPKGRPPQPEELLSIKRNADRLHHLIHQLMEFRKVETNHASLDLRQGDIVVFLRDTFMAFSPLFKHKAIQYTFDSSHPEYYCFFDPDKLEMIVSNLISNAAKNTPERGVVNMEVGIRRSASTDASYTLQIQISDSGNGILETDTQQIFSPFYRTEDSKKEGSMNSGIGLALVRSLIDYLNGQLTLSSQPGKGTVVHIELPLQHKPLPEIPESGKVTGNKSYSVHPGLFAELSPVELPGESTPVPDRQTLLIVEDNRELLKFLSKHFAQQYKVQLAKNGLEAMEKIEKTIPDLIISDAKMPGMDGISLCEKIKNNPQTSHIPFLLLTARTNDRNKMQGLKVGANAYLTKPFNLQELDLLVFNTLRSGMQLQQRFGNLEPKEYQPLPPNNQDREFLHQVTKLVETHYADPGFTISGLAQMLGISRSLLHLKMKKIAKLSASEFIKKFRMEKAEVLLKQGLSISDVAYKVGFNDPNYFSKVFKKEFEMLPSTYIEMNVPLG